MDGILGRMGELAALPHVVFQVIEAANDPAAPAAAIERAVTVDPGFAAKLLTEANSATLGQCARISSLREAVMRLGFNAVRNLALAVGTFDLFVGRTDAESLRRRAWWKTSVDTALYARCLAQRTKAAKPDDAYTAGLLHLVGRTVLDRCGGVPYSRVTEYAKQNDAPEHEAEFHVYGVHAGLVGQAAGTRWGFPAAIALAMNPIDAPEEGVEASQATLRAIVAIAAWMVTQKGEVPAWALENLGVSPEDLPTLITEASSAIAPTRQRLAS